MKKSVLVIDNDLNTCRELKSALEDEETEVYYVPSPNEALRVFMKWSFCLVIMDTQLPECNGCEVLRMMRQAKAIPILVLSAKVDVAKRTEILRAGANVYLEKPYDLEELLAQVRSLIALCTASIPLENQHYTLAFGIELIIDPTYWRVTLNGQQIELTHKEFSLLYCLASHREQVLSKEQLYHHVWKDDSEINLDATIKSHIRTLRQKLSPQGKNYIENVRGVGYRFTIDVKHSETAN